MTNESEEKKPSRFWIIKTELEKGLIVLLVIAALLISTLTILLFLYTKTKEPPPPTCETQICMKESLEILARIDNQIDPCNNFYAFACTNLPKSAERNQYFGPFTHLVEEAKLIAQDMYREPIGQDDHKLVKVQKKMYKACMNETAIANDAFNTVKGIIKAVGGWPVVEGTEWNETKFDWIQTTYKLRQLGYAHSSFLDVNVVPDPKNEQKYVFQLLIPEIKDVYSKWFDSDDKYGFMTDVAVVFGAEVHHALAQMTATYQFLQELQWQREEVMEEDARYQRITVGEFQQKEATIDWLEFINRIVGPYARVSKNDYVLFPIERDLDEWFGLLLRATNRTQANYMMWRVVEEALPYLTEELQKGRVKPRLLLGSSEQLLTRSEFCIEEIKKKFEPNPIEIMYVRNSLPKEKRDDIEELLNNMKLELLEVIKDIEWMSSSDKQLAVYRISEVNVIIGAPGDYFSDAIFENMNFDLSKINANNLMNLLALARRNYKDRRYGLVNKSKSESTLTWEELIVNMVNYDLEKNELFIPASIVEKEIYNEHRPAYLNYANMGLTLKYFFYGIIGSLYEWSNETEEAFDRKRECLIYEINAEKTAIPNHMINGLLAHNLALQVSYEAYKKIQKDDEGLEPLTLAGIEYSPEQLFWISSGYLFCHYTSPYYVNIFDSKVLTDFASMVSTLINSNSKLGDAFQCPLEAKVNTKHECKIF